MIITTINNVGKNNLLVNIVNNSKVSTFYRENNDTQDELGNELQLSGTGFSHRVITNITSLLKLQDKG